MKIKLDTSKLEKDLESKLYKKAVKVAEMSMQLTALQADTYGKRNAPWTDRTGLARQTTGASFLKSKDNMMIVCYIGVDYGKFLELDYGGKYKIVYPMFLYIKSNILKNQRILAR